VDGNSWSTELLRIGYDSGISNRLEILNGGTVTSAAAYIGDFNGMYNWARVSGPGSSWSITNDLAIGHDRGEHNQLIIENNAVVSSGQSYIGGLLRGCNYNTVTVSSGAQWNIGSELIVGLGSVGNQLLIQNGGIVTSAGTQIGQDFAGNSAYQNSVVLSGGGSKWINSGDLAFSGVASYLTITNGAEAVVSGGISLGDSSNELNLEYGGKLTVGADFNASAGDFDFNAGSTLSVSGQLSGLAEVEFDRRLEAVSVLGDLTVNGTFAPGNSPGESVINGALSMGSNGVLEMELGGYLAGVDSDRLTVAGLCVLDGTLEISFINGFIPKNGDSFHLFDWQDWVSGEFAEIDAPALGEGLQWDAANLYSTGYLNVIPEPAVLSLLLFAGMFSFVKHRLRH
jgi:T5SS/PEP-CTERM-associated repeat protein